jgi:hypothetical protein
MLFEPTANLLALTLSVAVTAVALPDAAPSVAVPNAVVPARNVTVPAGAAVPLAGVTVAVNCSVPFDAILAEPAVTTVFVPTGVPVTVTVAVAVEPPKVPEGT